MEPGFLFLRYGLEIFQILSTGKVHLILSKIILTHKLYFISPEVERDMINMQTRVQRWVHRVRIIIISIHTHRHTTPDDPLIS